MGRMRMCIATGNGSQQVMDFVKRRMLMRVALCSSTANADRCNQLQLLCACVNVLWLSFGALPCTPGSGRGSAADSDG